MQIRNTVVISAPFDVVWGAMLDIPYLTPCIPDAAFDKDLGDRRYGGRLRIKLGPFALTLAGELALTRADKATGTLAYQATGRDVGGLGRADASVSVSTAPTVDGTSLEIVTDLRLGGPVAHVGRQAIVTDIATSLLTRFGECLSTRLHAEQDAVRGREE